MVPARLSSPRRVLIAASAGTVFEWFDFFLYGSLAVFLAQAFFPAGNPTAALLASLATFGVGFVVRPLGAALFGHLGDRHGRHRIFFWTLALMGLATFAIGLLPGYESLGLGATFLLVLLRFLQGLAVGGEFGAASTYVAEHAPATRRGLFTAVIQGTGTVGLVMALLVVLGCRLALGEEAFRAWGWRLPFLLSLAPLLVALYIRRRLEESPVFASIRREGGLSRAPLREVFAVPLWRRRMLVALLSLTIAQGVLWHAGQFYPVIFLQSTLGLDPLPATALLSVSLSLGLLLFPMAGWLADRFGRRKVILAGFALGIAILFPAYQGMARGVAPAWYERYLASELTLIGPGCAGGILGRLEGECARLSEALLRAGLRHRLAEAEGEIRLLLRGQALPEASLAAAEEALGRVSADHPSLRGLLMAGAWLLLLMLPVALVCGPAAVWMLELFPARVRYTALGLPYTIGNGWFGGLTAFATALLSAWQRDPFAGLWYALILSAFCLLMGLWLMPETKGVDAREGLPPGRRAVLG